jgi:hypothetical protein
VNFIQRKSPCHCNGSAIFIDVYKDQGHETDFLSELEFFNYTGLITFSLNTLLSLLSATGSRVAPCISSDSRCASQSQTLLESNCRPHLLALKNLVIEFSQDRTCTEPITADVIPASVELLEQGRNIDLRFAILAMYWRNPSETIFRFTLDQIRASGNGGSSTRIATGPSPWRPDGSYVPRAISSPPHHG